MLHRTRAFVLRRETALVLLYLALSCPPPLVHCLRYRCPLRWTSALPCKIDINGKIHLTAKHVNDDDDYDNDANDDYDDDCDDDYDDDGYEDNDDDDDEDDDVDDDNEDVFLLVAE